VHDTIASVFVYIVWNVPVKQNEDLQGLHFVKRVCRYFAQRDVYVFALPCVCIALRSSVVIRSYKKSLLSSHCCCRIKFELIFFDNILMKM